MAATRKTGPDDIWNSGLAGFGTGALLGRLQGLVLPLSLLLRSCDFCQPLTMVNYLSVLHLNFYYVF